MHANYKTKTFPVSHLKVVNNDKQIKQYPSGSFGAGGRTPAYGGTTPAYGNQTPMHGGQTPMYSGGVTPGYGGATPSGGGATPSHGGATPAYQAGGAWDPQVVPTPAPSDAATPAPDDDYGSGSAPTPYDSRASYPSSSTPAPSPYAAASPYTSAQSPYPGSAQSPYPGDVQNPRNAYAADTYATSPFTPGQATPMTPGGPAEIPGWFIPGLHVTVDNGGEGVILFRDGSRFKVRYCSNNLEEMCESTSLNPVQPKEKNELVKVIDKTEESFMHSGTVLNFEGNEAVVQLSGISESNIEIFETVNLAKFDQSFDRR